MDSPWAVCGVIQPFVPRAIRANYRNLSGTPSDLGASLQWKHGASSTFSDDKCGAQHFVSRTTAHHIVRGPSRTTNGAFDEGAQLDLVVTATAAW